MGDRVLLIDDDQHLLSSFRRQLTGRFALEVAQGGEKGIELVREAQTRSDPFAVVVSDMRMPGMDGVETLSRIREIAPETVRMMLTGNADQQTAIDAINQGQIFRFFAKPTSAEHLALGLKTGIEQHQLITAERELLEKTLAGSIDLLREIMTLHDPVAGRLAARLRDYVHRLTEEFRMPDRWQLDIAAALSPLGNAMIPAEILAKCRSGKPLDASEREALERAPEVAHHLIAKIPRLGKVAEIVHLQDRGFDGSGFPSAGPRGAGLPLDARLLHILKDLAAIVDTTGCTHAAAFAEMAGRGEAYDPQLLARVRACLEKEPTIAADKLKKISLVDLMEGAVLASDVRLDNGHVILPAGTRIGPLQIERLRNLMRILTFIEPIEILDPGE